MGNYESVQELIWRAIKHDRISVTVGPSCFTYGQDVVKFEFTMNGRRSAVNIDITRINEPMALDMMKRALRDLFMYPYNSIDVRGR